MAIPSVVQGLIETGDGKVFELNSPKGAAWLETVGSFRFEPSGDSKACTVRREPSGYWYGCRKIAGKVRKKYIGKTSEVSTAKLEEIAEALEVPPVTRVAQVVEVAQGVAQVTEVAQEVAQDRLTALELEVANLRKALEALEEKLPGKLELGDSVELPKVDSEGAEELQNELGNLKAENEKLKQELADARTDYAKLLESSTAVKASREKEIAELRSQLETERADREEVEAQVEAEKTRYKELDKEFLELHEQWDGCKKEIRQLEGELSDLKQKSAAAGKDLPEAADLLNQLKARRKKSKTDLADLEVILEILES
jgi:DNA repair exonuclease SbcCD ATPase subunit